MFREVQITYCKTGLFESLLEGNERDGSREKHEKKIHRLSRRKNSFIVCVCVYIYIHQMYFNIGICWKICVAVNSIECRHKCCDFPTVFIDPNIVPF